MGIRKKRLRQGTTGHSGPDAHVYVVQCDEPGCNGAMYLTANTLEEAEHQAASRTPYHKNEQGKWTCGHPELCNQED